ncbi:MAG TPA: MoaD/ThiS family protein [Dongiaceae bacterium]|nr:MoaD/ThiS family protein [Dongiaceae bacterium]
MPTIHLTSHLRRVAPGGPTHVEAATLGAALDAYFAAVPRARSYILDDQGRLRRHVAVFIDGELLTDKRDLGRSVSPTSEIYVMQALSGG